MSVLGSSRAGPRPPHGGRPSASVVKATWHRSRYRHAARHRQARWAAYYDTPGVLCVSLISRSATGSSQARRSTGSGIRPHPSEAEWFAMIPDAADGIRGQTSEVPVLEPTLKTDNPRRPRHAFWASPMNPSLSGVRLATIGSMLACWILGVRAGAAQ